MLRHADPNLRLSGKALVEGQTLRRETPFGVKSISATDPCNPSGQDPREHRKRPLPRGFLIAGGHDIATQNVNPDVLDRCESISMPMPAR
ncbi:hypothetical protein OCAR_6474 [Afipia carboxidovorans OM5]|nr:hypothetical protein OCAR_6474 [Afipia carboxidovorans OM5]